MRAVLPCHSMMAGARQMVTGMLLTIRRQQSAKRGMLHDGGRGGHYTRHAAVAKRVV